VFYSGDFAEEKIQKAFVTTDADLDDKVDLLRRATLRLDEKYRQVVVLRATQGYSFKEIAEIIQLPIGTVLTRYSRAQKILIEMLNK
jgi:RNA polymerase sigma-70 factor (ECF subfamily)